MVLFTGKGGVGKTSVAAATAACLAAEGRRVLVTSTDPAHSLSDVLGQPLGDRPSVVADEGSGRLLAQQLDPRVRLERHWRQLRSYLVGALARGGLGELEAEELLLLPGTDELLGLLELRDQAASGAFDVICVDCAPTAETLTLLALPDTIRWYADQLLGRGNGLLRALGPLLRGAVPDAAVPDAPALDELDRLGVALGDVHELLLDTSRTSIRLVANAERLVVAETERLATSLSILGYAIDAVVVNRLLPEAVTDPLLLAWKERQDLVMAGLRDGFAPVPVLTAPLEPDEPVGAQALRSLGARLYEGCDPAEVLHRGRTVSVEQDGDAMVLRLLVPFASRDDVALRRRGPRLTVEAGRVRRHVDLPAALQRRTIGGARVQDGELSIRFVDAPVVTGAT